MRVSKKYAFICCDRLVMMCEKLKLVSTKNQCRAAILEKLTLSHACVGLSLATLCVLVHYKQVWAIYFVTKGGRYFNYFLHRNGPKNGRRMRRTSSSM